MPAKKPAHKPRVKSAPKPAPRKATTAPPPEPLEIVEDIELSPDPEPEPEPLEPQATTPNAIHNGVLRSGVPLL